MKADSNFMINTIGFYLIFILLAIIVIYYIYYMYTKHCNILEKFQVVSQLLDHNYGVNYNSGRNGFDKKTLSGEITLRPCQIYFVGKKDHEKCDKEYAENPLSTCKYEFKDNWVEIDNIKKNDKINTYPKKIYNQSYTENNITNDIETAQCFKKLNQDSDKRYIYNNNDLIQYNYGGNTYSDTLVMNHRYNNTDEYSTGNFISFKFNNNDEASTNYTNVVSSICSKKYMSSGLQQNMKFYKFILDRNNNIQQVKEAILNNDMKSFTVSDVNMEHFLSVDSLNIKFKKTDNYFELIQKSKISASDAEIYKFNYNYLCGNDESGVIMDFEKSTFNNNKSYLKMKKNNNMKVNLKYNNSILRVPNYALNEISRINDINKIKIINKINELKQQIIENYNRNPLSVREELLRKISQCGRKKDETLRVYNSFGINKNISELLLSSFDVINKTATVNVNSMPTTNVKIIQNYKKKLYVAIIKNKEEEVKVNLDNFSNYDNNIETFDVTTGSLSNSSGWIYCAGERQTCKCNGLVAYGTSGKYEFENSSGSIGCNNNVFGDPYWGRYKRCYCKTTHNPPEHRRVIPDNFTNYDKNNIEIEKFTQDSSVDPTNYVRYYYQTGSSQKTYFIELTKNCVCDILIVGGGGGGGGFGGGGGAGEVLFAENVVLKPGNYIVYVGKGGNRSGRPDNINGYNGMKSGIKNKDTNEMIFAEGGGGGGSRNTNNYPPHYVGKNGNSGGSGGGGGHSNNGNPQAQGGNTIANSETFSGSTFASYGHPGGKGRNGTNGGSPNHASGGGGGAGAPGQDAIQSTVGIRTWSTYGGGGDGGIGVNMSTYFPNYGDDGWFGGGGGGNTYANGGRQGYGNNYNGSNSISNNINSTGKGGGGNGGYNGSRNIYGQDGMADTGGGGGGGVWYARDSSGNGGSGVVLINFKQYLTESQYEEYKKEADKCTSTGTSTSSEVDCVAFTNYDKNNIEIEKFIGFELKPSSYKDGSCGGYVFLEKGKNYTNYKVEFTNIQSIQINILNSTICEINSNGINYDAPIADIKNNINNFTPTKSGFYKFDCRFFINSVDEVDIESYINIRCDNINLMDYMYNGDLWPSTWNSSRKSAIQKIVLFNSYLEDVKLLNNDDNSLKNFKELLNSKPNDLFNRNFWHDLYNKYEEDLNKVAILEDNNRCQYTNAYKLNKQPFKNNCNIMSELNRFVEDFNESLKSDNVNNLFAGKSFTKPSFVKSPANITFTSDLHNINDYITYEKKNNVNDRTQKSIEDSYYNYFNDEDTERSIYVKS